MNTWLIITTTVLTNHWASKRRTGGQYRSRPAAGSEILALPRIGGLTVHCGANLQDRWPGVAREIAKQMMPYYRADHTSGRSNTLESGLRPGRLEVVLVYTEKLSDEFDDRQPFLSHSSASARAASKSRDCSGGRNFAVESRTREPFKVPMIRSGHFAPLPAQER